MGRAQPPGLLPDRSRAAPPASVSSVCGWNAQNERPTRCSSCSSSGRCLTSCEEERRREKGKGEIPRRIFSSRPREFVYCVSLLCSLSRVLETSSHCKGTGLGSHCRHCHLRQPVRGMSLPLVVVLLAVGTALGLSAFSDPGDAADRQQLHQIIDMLIDDGGGQALFSLMESLAICNQSRAGQTAAGSAHPPEIWRLSHEVLMHGATSTADCAVVSSLPASAFAVPSCLAVDCCSCGEIACRPEDQRVIGINSSSVTAGTLPPDLFSQLTEIRSLCISDALYAGMSDNALQNSLFDYAHGLRSAFQGSLPEGPLPLALETLKLVGGFTSELPLSWFSRSAPSLVSMKVIGNMVGPLTAALSQLNPSIETVFLAGNFQRTLPLAQLLAGLTGGAPALRFLTVSGNFLGPLSGLESMPSSIESLCLMGGFRGELDASDWMQSMPNLTSLVLAGQFSGPIPSSIGGPSSALTRLQLVGQMSGSIPPDIFRIPLLSLLWITSSSSSGSLTADICGLSASLVDLQIKSQLSGPIPACLFSEMAQLQSLVLQGQFSGDLPGDSLCAMPSADVLTSLRLGGTFSGSLPSCISTSFPHLRHLELAGLFSGEIPPNLCGSKPNLVSLALAGNFNGSLSLGSVLPPPDIHPGLFSSFSASGMFTVPGAAPDSPSLSSPWPPVFDFSPWKGLSSIRVSGDLAGMADVVLSNPSGPVGAGSSMQLCCGGNISSSSLSLAASLFELVDVSNMFIGNGTADLFNIASKFLLLDSTGLSVLHIAGSGVNNVVMLSASHNQLQELNDLFLLTSLQFLDVSHNAIANVLPILSDTCDSETSNRLSYVDISSNQITGLGSLTQCPLTELIFLNISQNLFSECLPAMLPLVVTNVRTLDMSSNNFSGPVSYPYSQFPLLSKIDLRGNPLLTVSLGVEDPTSDGNDGGSSTLPYIVSATNPLDLHLADVATFQCPNLYLKYLTRHIELLVDDASSRFAGCSCLSGFMGTPPRCTPCSAVSQQAYCPGDGEILAASGYWLTPPLDLAKDVLPEYMIPCKDVGLPTTVCVSASGTDVCAAGHSGRLCAACKDGWFSMGQNGCLQCPTNVAPLVVSALLFFLILAAVAFFSIFRQFRRNELALPSRRVAGSPVLVDDKEPFLRDAFPGSSKPQFSAQQQQQHSMVMIDLGDHPVSRVLIEFAQNLVVIAGPFLAQVGGGANVLSSVMLFNVSGFPCYFDGWGIWEEVFAPLIVALALQVFAFVFAFLARVFLMRKQGHGPQKGRRSVGLVRHSLWLYQISFLAVAIALMSSWVCETDPGLHQSFIVAMPSQLCNPSLRAVSLAAFLAVVVVPCAAYAAILRRGMCIAGKTSTGDGFSKSDRDAASDGLIHEVVVFGSTKYRQGLGIWDLWFLMRRILFAVAYILLPPSNLFSTAYLWTLVLLALLLDLAFQPYLSPALNRIQTMCWIVLALNLGSGGRFQVPATTQQNSLSWTMLIFNIGAMVGLIGFWWWNQRQKRRLLMRAWLQAGGAGCGTELVESLLQRS